MVQLAEVCREPSVEACFICRSHGGELNPTLAPLGSPASPGATAVLAHRPLKPAHTHSERFCSDGKPQTRVEKPTSLRP